MAGLEPATFGLGNLRYTLKISYLRTRLARSWRDRTLRSPLSIAVVPTPGALWSSSCVPCSTPATGKRGRVIPVLQTRFREPGGPPAGNCFAACLASLLECPIGDVPYTVGLVDWWSPIVDWLAERGFAPLHVPAQGFAAGAEDLLCIAGGMGPRGIPHSVLWRRHKVVHDPHPSGGGLVGEPKDFVFLVPLDPRPESEACNG